MIYIRPVMKYDLESVLDCKDEEEFLKHQRVYLKIGFTDNVKNRNIQYETDGCMGGFLYIREGTIEDEKYFHFYFRKYKADFLQEIFIYSSEIITEIKNISLEDLHQYIWENRKEFFGSDSERLVKFANEYGYDLEEHHFTHFYRMKSNISAKDPSNFFSGELLTQIENINNLRKFSDSMKIYCQIMDEYNLSETDKLNLDQCILDPFIPECYNFYGNTQIIRGRGCQESKLKAGMIGDKTIQELTEKIYQTFKVGEKYNSKFIKLVLKQLYIDLSIEKTPKANDLSTYFVLKPVKIKEESTGKFINGFELISKNF